MRSVGTKTKFIEYVIPLFFVFFATLRMYSNFED